MQKISVILPVKNGKKYISEAIESVLYQTCKDFELLIFDDDSTDRTLEIIKTYDDPRVKVFTGKNGFIANLNKGIEISAGQYIARMDADDIMNPIRLETQLEIMETRKVDVCASWINIFGEGFNSFIQRNIAGLIESPVEKMVTGNFIAHPTVMLRKEFLIKNKLSYADYQYAEDYKLWFEIAKKGGIFYMEPEALLFYRISKDQVTRTHKQETIKNATIIQKEIIDYLLKKSAHPEIVQIKSIYDSLCRFEEKDLITFKSIAAVLQEYFSSRPPLYA